MFLGTALNAGAQGSAEGITPLKAPSPDKATIVLNAQYDPWNDGTGYQMLLDATHTAYGKEYGSSTAEINTTFVYDAAATYTLPLNADFAGNNIVRKAVCSIEVPEGTYDVVVLNPSPSESKVYLPGRSGNVAPTGDDFFFEKGRIYEFVIGMDGSNDKINLYVDGTYYEVHEPQDIHASDITADAATIVWEAAGESTWNLRYRTSAKGVSYDFEDLGQLSAFKTIDNDGDENGWDWQQDMNYAWSGEGMLTSRSWKDKNLTPDNWIVTPKVDLFGSVSLMASGFQEKYSDEHFAIYVCEEEDFTAVEDFKQLSDEFITTFGYQSYSASLEAYEGKQGYVALRHFNCSGINMLLVDDLTIGIPAGEWVEIDGVGEPQAVLNGLAPLTDYTVEVQTVGALGKSKWVSMGSFTTGEASAINAVGIHPQDSGSWFTVSGTRLSGKPARKGVYIFNGKKVVVR